MMDRHVSDSAQQREDVANFIFRLVSVQAKKTFKRNFLKAKVKMNPISFPSKQFLPSYTLISAVLPFVQAFLVFFFHEGF